MRKLASRYRRRMAVQKVVIMAKVNERQYASKVVMLAALPQSTRNHTSNSRLAAAWSAVEPGRERNQKKQELGIQEEWQKNTGTGKALQEKPRETMAQKNTMAERQQQAGEW